MRKSKIDKLTYELTIKDSEPPLVWATTLLPIHLSDGWRRGEKLPDGCFYMHPKFGLASFRGLEDDAGRKWMHLSVMPTGWVHLNDIGVLRNEFFPQKAIVSMAIPSEQADMIHLWWSVDDKGIPMDPGWKDLIFESENLED